MCKRTGPARVSRAVLGAIVVFCGASCAPRADATAQPAATGTFSSECSRERADVKTDLGTAFRSQLADGSIAYHGANEFLAYNPLLSTLCLDIYRHDGDRVFLDEAHTAITKQINYYLSRYDRDGDFLLERTSWPASTDADEHIEDVGFNTMFVLDMLALSEICVALDSPVDALFWYQGTKTVGHQIIGEMYDIDAGYFLPVDNARKTRVNEYRALAAVAADFDDELGGNVSASILRNYVLTEQAIAPEVPLQFLSWTGAPAAASDRLAPENLVKTLLLLAVLTRNGLEEDATRYAGPIGAGIHGMLRSSGGDSPYASYLACQIAGGGYKTLLPAYPELDLFESVASLYGVLLEEERGRLAADLDVVRTLLSDGAVTTSSPDEAEQAIRNVYWTVSALKKRWRTHSLFTPRDREKIPGFDVYLAYAGLQDGLVATLQEAESRLSWLKTGGLTVTATLLNEKSAPGEAITLRIALAAMGGPSKIESVVVLNDGAADTLLASSLSLAPGQPAKELWYRHKLAANTSASAITTVRFTVQVELAGGGRARYHFNRGVYVSRPLSVSLSFPEGRTLGEASVPLQLHIVKNVPGPVVVHTEFYSPAGLQLKEGRSQKLVLAAEQRTASIALNVLVPTPCRPGPFPFTLKFFGNGVDEGTIRSSLFKHFQWIFAGPFPKKKGGLRAEYPPEKGVDLRATFPGAQIPITWVALPKAAYSDQGQIQLNTFLREESVGYLYTVLKTEWETETFANFGATAPSIVYINGDAVAEIEEPGDGMARANVTLKRGMNSILIKMLSAETSEFYFQLGDEEQLTLDDLNNNLWELIDGYQEFLERSVNLAGGDEFQRVVTLTYKNPEANSVAVIGTFNGWSPVDSNMRRVRPGEWEISLHLPPGRYSYRFLVNNNLHVIDPNSPSQEPDGYGGRNSVLFVR